MATLVAGYTFPYKWNPAHQARVCLLKNDAAGSEIVWCAVAPCYVIHPCNGFENTDGTVTLDVVAHASKFESSQIGPDAKGSALERWTIDPVALQIARQLIDGQPQEFPHPGERRLGQPCRHDHTAGLQPDGAASLSAALR